MKTDKRILRLPEIVGRGYGTFWNFKGRYRVCKGSRASKKSKTTALNQIGRIMEYPEANLLVVRKTYRTLKDSCFAELKWAIHRLGVDAWWAVKESPLEMTRIKYSDAWNKGYNFGQSIEEKFTGADVSNTDLDTLNNNVAAIATNTANTVDALKLSNEDIKMLRNIAERQAINRYTTAEIKVEMTNNNNISSEMDLDGVMNLFEAKITEALVTSAEGVHI